MVRDSHLQRLRVGRAQYGGVPGMWRKLGTGEALISQAQHDAPYVGQFDYGREDFYQ